MTTLPTPELIAAVFETSDGATDARLALEKLDRDMQVVQLNRIAVLVKHQDGQIALVEPQADRGRLWSLAHNAAFIVGSTAGKGLTRLPTGWKGQAKALAAKLNTAGFPEDVVQRIGELLKAGHSILLTVVDNDLEKEIVTRELTGRGGRLVESALPSDLVTRLQAAAPTATGGLGSMTASAAAAVGGAAVGVTARAKGVAKKARSESADLVHSARAVVDKPVEVAAEVGAKARGAARKARSEAGELVDAARAAVDDPAKAVAEVTTTAKKVARKAQDQGAAAAGAAAAAVTTVSRRGGRLRLPPAPADPSGQGSAVSDEGSEVAEAPAAPAADAVATAPAKKRAKAAPDDLQQLPDVGPVYERLLHSHGLTRFSQVGKLSADELRAIFSGTDPESSLPVAEITVEQAAALIAAARQLAGKK